MGYPWARAFSASIRHVYRNARTIREPVVLSLDWISTIACRFNPTPVLLAFVHVKFVPVRLSVLQESHQSANGMPPIQEQETNAGAVRQRSTEDGGFG